MNAHTFRTKLTRNIQSRVAKRLGLTRGHISLVAAGLRKSARVEKALAAEYARVDRQVARFERNTLERAA